MFFRSVIFDLDGTITDSAPGIINSVEYALQKMSVRYYNKDELYSFVGPPLHESFQKYCNCTEEESFTAVATFREYFSEKGMYENTLYPGMLQLLEDLFNKNVPLYIATSKPEFYCRQILHNFNIASFFKDIAGSSMDGSGTEKTEVIAALLKRNDVSEAVMVGDRLHDIQGARSNGLYALGVVYGYGSVDELKNARADYICEDITSLHDFLVKNSGAN